jgi:hypothetical protein
VLERLALDNPAFLHEVEWVDALIKLDTEQALFTLLNHLCAGRVLVRNGFHMSRALSVGAQKHALVQATLIERYRSLSPGPIRRVLEIAMQDLANEEVFMALFDCHVNAVNSIGGVSRAIRNLAIGRKPSEEWIGAFEEFGLPLTELRARLFAMLPANDARARLAKECLMLIEEHRDESGRVSNEPRHPDITTCRPWPDAKKIGQRSADDFQRRPFVPGADTNN